MVSVARQPDRPNSTFQRGARRRPAPARRSSSFWVASWVRQLAAWALLAGVALHLTSVAHAQNEGEGPFSPANLLSPLPDVLSEGTLQPKARLWFSDRDGNLVLAPEEFAEDYFGARSKSAAGGMGLPPATLERIEVVVNVQGDFARVSGRFDAIVSQDYATAVNLEFGSVQLDQWSFSGEPTQNRLQLEREDPGWRWILLGKPNTTYAATLNGVTRIASELERRNLRISLPTAPCRLKVQLPANAVDVRVRSEDVLQRTTTESGLELEINTNGGDFVLSWRDQQEALQVAAVNATSNTKFEIVDPAQPWLATTTLTVRWHGQDASSQIGIKLPNGGQWRAPPNSDPERYRIFSREVAPADAPPVADTGAAATNPVALELVLENLDLARNETVEIVLEWEWAPGPLGTDTSQTEVKIESPVIDGVDQHAGTIDCVVTLAFAVVFKEGQGAQLTYQGPLMDASPRQQLQFKFDRQPFDLTLLFRREQSLPTIRPTYWVHVDRNKLTLTMWFDCSFDTNQLQMELGLILDEWVIQENTARMVSKTGDLFSNDGEILRVEQQVDRNYVIRSANGDVTNYGGSRHVDQTWRVVAERSWTSEDKELYFQVPQIVRGLVNGNPEIDHGSGALLVTSDSNVLLNWQEAAGTGLQRDSFSTEYQRYIRQLGVRKPLVFRFQSSETTPQWGGRAEMLARQVALEQHVDLEVIASEMIISQNFEIQVANEPISDLRFALRKDAGDFQPPQVTVNGNLVSSPLLATVSEQELDDLLFQPPRATDADRGAAIQAAVAASGSNNSGVLWQIYQIEGRPELLGATQVTIVSEINWKKGEKPRVSTTDGRLGNAAARLDPSAEPLATDANVPLAQLLLPSGTRKMRQDWTLRTDLQVETVLKSDDGQASEAMLSGQRIRPLAESQKEIQLSLHPRRLQGIAPVRIDKSWLQTFVNDSRRRERFVVHVEAANDELQLKLPREAIIREGQVKVSVDGFSVTPGYEQSTDIVTIPLAGNQEGGHVVEISYFLPNSLTWLSALNVSPPEILGADQVDQFYWQLITPSVQHLGWSPKDLTAEWTWQWSRLWWNRVSRLNQRQLEQWIGASFQESPPASANSYVMSGRGSHAATTVWVLSRFILWFPVGLVAIAISFIALNYSFVRKPVVIYGFAILIAALATIWPDVAVLLGQTAVVSLGLVALVWVMQAAVDSRVRRRSVFSARASTYVERSDHVSVSRGVRSLAPAPTHAGSSAGVNGG